MDTLGDSLTGSAPYELGFGRPPLLPIFQEIRSPVLDSTDRVEPQDYFYEIHKLMNLSTTTTVRSSTWLNKHRLEFGFVFYPCRVKPNKLLPESYGPFPVVKVIRHEEITTWSMSFAMLLSSQQPNLHWSCCNGGTACRYRDESKLIDSNNQEMIKGDNATMPDADWEDLFKDARWLEGMQALCDVCYRSSN